MAFDRSGAADLHADRGLSLTIRPTRARARAKELIIVEFRGFSARSAPSGDVTRMFAFVSAAYQESAFRGASQALRCVSRRPPKGCGRRTYTSRSRLRSFNRCAARLAPRAERSAWSWTSTLEIRPDLENDEIADWRRRGHRDADARRGARFYPGRWALPHHRDMAPFIPLWNECRRHLGLAGRLHASRPDFGGKSSDVAPLSKFWCRL
jgi:hypothetical protein